MHKKKKNGSMQISLWLYENLGFKKSVNNVFLINLESLASRDLDYAG